MKINQQMNYYGENDTFHIAAAQRQNESDSNSVVDSTNRTNFDDETFHCKM